jgi:hypothetical protein
MINATKIRLFGKDEYVRYPLSALSEIKRVVGCAEGGLDALGEAIRSAGAWDFPRVHVEVLVIGLRHGSKPDATADEIMDSDIDMPGLLALVTQCLETLVSSSTPSGGAQKNPPKTLRSSSSSQSGRG